jgi:hypothetical protein
MQRIALGLAVVLLVAVGCAPATRSTRLGPLPDPVMATRMPRPPVAAVPRPVPARPPIAVSPETLPERLERSWLPPGGMARGRWKTIIVHHSAAPQATPQSMHEYHLKQRGWDKGLGYHFVIGNGQKYPDGEVYVGPRWRQQVTGAHCKSKSGRYLGKWRPDNYFNDHGIGICLIGNFEQSAPTRRQLAALSQLVAFLCDHTGISPNDVYGHGEVTNKTLCPGRYMSMGSVRRAANVALVQRRRDTQLSATGSDSATIMAR